MDVHNRAVKIPKRISFFPCVIIPIKTWSIKFLKQTFFLSAYRFFKWDLIIPCGILLNSTWNDNIAIDFLMPFNPFSKSSFFLLPGKEKEKKQMLWNSRICLVISCVSMLQLFLICIFPFRDCWNCSAHRTKW